MELVPGNWVRMRNGWVVEVTDVHLDPAENIFIGESGGGTVVSDISEVVEVLEN